jgi:hypothetical protein
MAMTLVTAQPLAEPFRRALDGSIRLDLPEQDSPGAS